MNVIKNNSAYVRYNFVELTSSSYELSQDSVGRIVSGTNIFIKIYPTDETSIEALFNKEIASYDNKTAQFKNIENDSIDTVPAIKYLILHVLSLLEMVTGTY